jgi:hypothetical protein
VFAVKAGRRMALMCEKEVDEVLNAPPLYLRATEPVRIRTINAYGSLSQNFVLCVFFTHKTKFVLCVGSNGTTRLYWH